MKQVKNLQWHVLLYASLIVIIATRVYIYVRYNLNIVDTDQAYMWLGAKDFAKGHFYEPRYYGQNYNTFMEALLASPFLHHQWKVYQVLPIITNFLSLFPYLFTAFYLFYRRQQIKALMVLGILICMPVQYDLINSLPRGFVTGLFFTSGFILSIVNPQSVLLLFLNSVMAILAYYVNPNSLLVSVPFLAYLFFIHYKNKTYYYVSGTALLTAYPIDLFFNAFYRHHPDYVYQSTFNTFSTKYFIQSITHLDERFQHLTFFFPNQCYTLLAAMLILALVLLKHNRKAFLAFVSLLALLVFSLFASKISDGSTWAFMSYSRMFLGLPIAMYLLVAGINYNFKKHLRYLLAIPFLFAVFKLQTLPTQLDKEDKRDIARGVRVLSLESVWQTTQFYKNACLQHNCRFLLVSSTFWLNTIVADAGPAIDDTYPETQETRFEKRYWVREKNRNRIVPRFVFLSSDYSLDKKIGENSAFQVTRLDDYGLLLIQKNQWPMGKFIDYINQVEPGLND